MRFFELLARPRDAAGREYQAAECIGALDASGLRAEFDALMLLRSVQLVRKLESRARNAGFFLNLSPAMLARIERSEEHTSELQSPMRNSYAVFCLKTKQNTTPTPMTP